MSHECVCFGLFHETLLVANVKSLKKLRSQTPVKIFLKVAAGVACLN